MNAQQPPLKPVRRRVELRIEMRDDLIYGIIRVDDEDLICATVLAAFTKVDPQLLEDFKALMNAFFRRSCGNVGSPRSSLVGPQGGQITG